MDSDVKGRKQRVTYTALHRNHALSLMCVLKRYVSSKLAHRGCGRWQKQMWSLEMDSPSRGHRVSLRIQAAVIHCDPRKEGTGNPSITGWVEWAGWAGIRALHGFLSVCTVLHSLTCICLYLCSCVCLCTCMFEGSLALRG